MSPAQASGHHCSELWMKHCDMRTSTCNCTGQPAVLTCNVHSLIPKVVWG